MLFGAMIKKLREQKDLKQEDIAKMMNVDRSTVGKWENGSSKPDYEKMLKLADYFKVTVDYLLGREEIKTIAAHKEGEGFTEDELKDIEEFKNFVRSKRKKE